MDNIKLDNAAILEALAKLAVSADNPDAASAIANLAAQLGETTLQPEPEEPVGSATLRVGPLHRYLSADDLLDEIFSRFGKLAAPSKIVDSVDDIILGELGPTRTVRAYGYVTYADLSDAKQAQAAMDGHNVCGTSLVVAFATTIPAPYQPEQQEKKYQKKEVIVSPTADRKSTPTPSAVASPSRAAAMPPPSTSTRAASSRATTSPYVLPPTRDIFNAARAPWDNKHYQGKRSPVAHLPYEFRTYYSHSHMVAFEPYDRWARGIDISSDDERALGYDTEEHGDCTDEDWYFGMADGYPTSPAQHVTYLLYCLFGRDNIRDFDIDARRPAAEQMQEFANYGFQGILPSTSYLVRRVVKIAEEAFDDDRKMNPRKRYQMTVVEHARHNPDQAAGWWRDVPPAQPVSAERTAMLREHAAATLQGGWRRRLRRLARQAAGGSDGGAPATAATAPTASRDLDEDDAMLLECATLYNTAGSHESDIEDIEVSDGGSDA